jgi:hypothetical protein
VSDHPLFWFHCGRCGSLFQARSGEADDRLCAKCGFDPSIGLVAEAPAPRLSPHRGGNPPGDEPPGLTPHRGKRTVRKRKNQHLMLKLIAGWTLVLTLIILGARKMWPSETPVSRPPVVTDAAPAATEAELAMLREVTPLCSQVFAGFLTAGIPEQRNQFVLRPVITASRMARFYSMNPTTDIDPSTLGITANELLRLPEETAIETLWQSADGRKYDAVFREENGEWRLDWDHFARYSDYPWALFLAGTGPPEGEFRLLARERLAEERRNEETISLVLYAPRFGQPDATGYQSPEFLISRNTPEGRMIDAAFRAKRQDYRIFDSRLPEIDPDDMIRLRVKVRRTEVDLERKFEITGVLACHWYSVDDPGIDPANFPKEQSEETPPNTEAEAEAEPADEPASPEEEKPDP